MLEVIQQGHDEYAAKGKYLMTQMETFDTYFSVKLAYLIFSTTKQFSTNLQGIEEGTSGAQSLWSETAFTKIYRKMVESANGLMNEPALPCYRKAPKRFDEGAQPHHYIHVSPEERYRQAYLKALDYTSGEIGKRFDQSDLVVVRDVESLLIDVANGKDVQIIPKAVAEYFRVIIDLGHFWIQLLILPDAINTAIGGIPIHVMKVTHVRTIADTLNQNKIVKSMLREVVKLLRAYLIFSITSATA